MAIPAVPNIVYPAGDTVDMRRYWFVVLDPATDRIAVEVRIKDAVTSVVIWTTYLNQVSNTRIIRIPADIGVAPGTSVRIDARAANATGASAYSSNSVVVAKSTDNDNPYLSYADWRDNQ